MKTLSLLAAVLTLGLALGVGNAEAAKRLGSAKSSGMQRQSTAVDKAGPATPAAPANATNAAAAKAPATAAPAPAATPPKRSWMGPLAGLAAGLGLAALASHFGFGEQMANMLMIGLLVMAALAVVGFIMRRRAAAQSGAASHVGNLPYATATASATSTPTSAGRGYDVAMPGGSMIGSALAQPEATAPGTIPAGFDVEGFVGNAKLNFIRLQASNDSGNLEDIRQFTTPEMFTTLKQDIDSRNGASQHTEVVGVEADVLEVVEDADQYVVSVRFTGTIREDHSAVAEPFSEIWHLSKTRHGAGGWVLSGIQQLQ